MWERQQRCNRSRARVRGTRRRGCAVSDTPQRQHSLECGKVDTECSLSSCGGTAVCLEEDSCCGTAGPSVTARRCTDCVKGEESNRGRSHASCIHVPCSFHAMPYAGVRVGMRDKSRSRGSMPGCAVALRVCLARLWLMCSTLQRPMSKLNVCCRGVLRQRERHE